MKNIFIINLLLLFTLGFSFAQKPDTLSEQLKNLSVTELDSIVELSSNNDEYALYIAACNNLANHYRTKEPNDSLYVDNKLAAFTGFIRLGEYNAAKEVLDLLIPFIEKKFGKKSPLYITAYGYLGLIYQYLDKYEDAVYICTEGLQLFIEIQGKEHPHYSAFLSRLATGLIMSERYFEAEPIALEVKNIREKSLGTEAPSLLYPLEALAEIYLKTKQYDKGAPLYIQTKKIIEKNYGKESITYTNFLNNWASYCSETKDFATAIAIYKEAIEIITKKSPKHPDYGYYLLNLGRTYIDNKEFDKGESYLKKCLIFRTETHGKTHSNTILVYNHLTVLFNESNRPDSALVYGIKSLVLNNGHYSNELDLDLLISEISSQEYNSMNRLLESLQNLIDVFKTYYITKKEPIWLERQNRCSAAANKILNRYKNSFSSDEDKLRILKENIEFAKKSISTAYELQKPESIEIALTLAEQNKSILLMQSLRGKKAQVISNLPDSLAKKETALQEALSQIKKEIVDNKDSAKQDGLNKTLGETNIKINRFTNEIKKHYPKYHQLKYAAVDFDVQSIQQQLDKKSLLLEYFSTKETQYIFVLTAAELRLIALPISAETLSTQIQQLRESLVDYESLKLDSNKARNKYSSTAHWFFKEILAPALENTTNIDHLIIIPDGELGHIPFEAFLTEKPKDDIDYKDFPYLLNKYKVSYNYAATLWKENMTAVSKQNNGKILAVAAKYKGKEDSTALRANRAPHLRNLRDALNDLPAAKEEIESLSRLFKGDFWFDKDASELNFKNEASKYNIIHLAMHGLLNVKHPILSSLAFTENGDSLEDNFLQAYEISHLQLNANLVVLSACETGYGKFQQGEGVMSLARSFMYAGVPSLVVSLWQVNDASTSAIMQLFYKNLAKGMDKAGALRQAKLTYIGSVDGMAAHPAFWAPFVQLGDSRPIVVQTRGGVLSMWWIGGGLAALALLGGGVIVMRRSRKAA